jgi:glycopeptide antibiotics resistance protein
MSVTSAPDTPPHRRPFAAAFLVYAAFVVYATAMPFQFTFDPQVLALKRQFISWNPMRLGTGEPTPISDLVGNIPFFVPVGMFAFLAMRRTGWAIAASTGLGLGLSLLVETLQFFTPSRVPSCGDVISNTFGAWLGAALAALYRYRLSASVHRHLIAWTHREPLVPVLAGLTCVFTLRGLVPFDVVTAVNVLKRSVRAARLDVWAEPASIGAEICDVLLFAVLAALVFAVSRGLKLGRNVRHWVHAAAGVTLLAVAFELAQLLIRSRVTAVRDALDGAVGGIVGATAAWTWLKLRPRLDAWTAVLVVYAGLLAIAALEPFSFRMQLWASRPELSKGAYIPYYALFFKDSLDAVTEFLDDLFLYLPFGYLVARRLAPRFALTPATGLGDSVRVGWLWAAAAGVSAAWAAILEAGQIGIPGRYVDVSDTTTAALGGVLGAFLWAWFETLRGAVDRHAHSRAGNARTHAQTSAPGEPAVSATR